MTENNQRLYELEVDRNAYEARKKERTEWKAELEKKIKINMEENKMDKENFCGEIHKSHCNCSECFPDSIGERYGFRSCRESCVYSCTCDELET